MDTMKKRVRAFTEGSVIMVCPVLLAVSLQKVDTKSKGNGSVRGSISPLAAFTLEAGLLPFLCLCFCLSKLVTHDFADLLFRASKLLVHLCALLLMALAYGILLLIDMKNVYYLFVLVLLVPPILWRCYKTMRNGHDHDAHLYRGYEDKLETSIDFSAAVTALLFLGLEGLALEGQSSNAGSGAQGLLAASLGMSFVTCLAGVFIMLMATVPPMITENVQSNDACNFVEVLNIVLAVAFAANVFLITFVPLGELACLVCIQPFISFFVWMYETLGVDGDTVQRNSDQEVKPAPMELTKVTFTGFLAVSVPAFNNRSISNYTCAFVLITGAAVIAGLVWRLLTHRTPAPSAMVKAANVASFCAHLYVFLAVIPFAFMASKALK